MRTMKLKIRNNEDVNTPNVNLWRTTRERYVLAPRLIKIGGINKTISFPKLILTKEIAFIDYKGPDSQITLVEEFAQTRPYPLWIKGEPVDKMSGCYVSMVMVPKDKEEEITAYIENMPSRIKVMYGEEAKITYLACIKTTKAINPR